VGVARASLEELLLDYEKNRSYWTYRTYVEEFSAEMAANTLICLIHQANYLLDQQLRQLEQDFLSEGGFTEKLYHARTLAKKPDWNKP